MMYNCCCRSIIVQILIIVAFSIFLSGCGKKAPPKPPRQAEPPVVDDLNYSLDGDNLKLTWTISEVKRKVKSGLGGFYVFRSKKSVSVSVSESDCKNCPKIFKRVADISLEHMGNSGKDSIKYAEVLEKGYRYIYKVVVYTTNGVMGEDSNVVDFTY
ncbi:MAG: hypothetical protein LWX54_08060 [Deltaproteobacteria bacterium]|jgi:hypothetical protein|nr:hypothetical protein [Deltaproteobacteria bacterium]